MTQPDISGTGGTSEPFPLYHLAFMSYISKQLWMQSNLLTFQAMTFIESTNHTPNHAPNAIMNHVIPLKQPQTQYQLANLNHRCNSTSRRQSHPPRQPLAKHNRQQYSHRKQKNHIQQIPT